jgi:hypothetical protein
MHMEMRGFRWISRHNTCDGVGVPPNPSSGYQPPPDMPRLWAKDFVTFIFARDEREGVLVLWDYWHSGGLFGRNSYGKIGYTPVCPPRGAKARRYDVTAYALRERLELPEGSDPRVVLARTRELALASVTIVGRYRR